MFALAFQFAAFVFLIHVALYFLPLFVVLIRAFSWGQDRSWTVFPNFNGFVAAAVTAGLWLYVSWSIGLHYSGYGPAPFPAAGLLEYFSWSIGAPLPIAEVYLPPRGHWLYPLFLGMANLGLGAIAVGILLTVLGWMLQFVRWLFIPRRYR